MGRGDKKTAKGKRTIGSYGNTRKKKVTVIPVAKTEKPKKEAKEAVAKTVTAKKTAAPKKEVTETKVAAPKKTTAKKAVEKEA